MSGGALPYTVYALPSVVRQEQTIAQTSIFVGCMGDGYVVAWTTPRKTIALRRGSRSNYGHVTDVPYPVTCLTQTILDGTLQRESRQMMGCLFLLRYCSYNDTINCPLSSCCLFYSKCFGNFKMPLVINKIKQCVLTLRQQAQQNYPSYLSGQMHLTFDKYSSDHGISLFKNLIFGNECKDTIVYHIFVIHNNRCICTQ